MILNLEENTVGVVILGDSKDIKEGDIVKGSSKVMQVGVGEQYLSK